jgi:p-methyltransferase
MDCLIVANTDTSTEGRRRRFRTANSLRARIRHGLDVLRKNRYDPLAVPRYVLEWRQMQQVLDRQNSLLIEDQLRPWCPTNVINYVRAGRQVPIVTRDNAGEYLTWFREVTLNGVILLDYLSRHGLSGEIVQTFGFESMERVDRLLSEQPVCVVVSTTFVTLDVILALREIHERVAQRSPRTKVVVGSSVLRWYINNYPEIVPTVLDCCDIIIDDAQGLDTLCRLVQALKRGTGLESVPNLVYRRRGRTCRTPREPDRIPIDDLAPDWSRWLPAGYTERVAVQTSQGCPFTCRFCDFRLMNRTDYKSLEVLRRELRSLKAVGVRKVDFVDDLFTLPEERLVAICRMMLEERFDFSWFCLSRSSGLSTDAVQLMAEAGCTMVNVGMESADPTVLANMNKQTTVEGSYELVEAFSRHGIAVFTNIILGFPGETDESIERTIAFLNDSGVDAYFLNLFQVGRGTLADTSSFRKRFALEGEYILWKHLSGSSLEFAGKIGDVVARVSEDVLRVGGLEAMQMLMNDGYTREELAAMEPVMRELAGRQRGPRVQPSEVERSRTLLGRLGELEQARGRMPCAAPNGRQRTGAPLA